jgi:hypothetical protein
MAMFWAGLLPWGWLDAVQRAFYAGKIKRHCVKFLGIATPDGLIAAVHGPYPGMWEHVNKYSVLFWLPRAFTTAPV